MKRVKSFLEEVQKKGEKEDCHILACFVLPNKDDVTSLEFCSLVPEDILIELFAHSIAHSSDFQRVVKDALLQSVLHDCDDE